MNNNDELKYDRDAIHEDVVKNVRKQMPESEQIHKLADFFKICGDNTRVKILWALSKSEMCVCDISVLLNMTKSAVSHQLKVLKEARLVRSRKDGKHVYYTLDDDHVKNIFDMGMTHVDEWN